MAGQLHRRNPISVIDEQFCIPRPMQLSVKSKLQGLIALFSDTLYKVFDTNQNHMFEVTKDLSALNSQMVLFDAAGSPIATMCKKMFSWHNRWTVYKGLSTQENDILYTLKASSTFLVGRKLDIYLPANTREETWDFRVKAAYSDISCTVYKGDAVIAEVASLFTWGGLVGKDEMQVMVNPDVDYAFIVTLVVILNEMKRARRRNNNRHHSHMMH